MPLRSLVEELRASPEYRGQVVFLGETQPRPARWADEIPALSPLAVEALKRQGVERLYSHQAEAIAAALAGEHVTVAAGTASGKTLCFLVPIAEALHRRPTARALLIYPTKALSQDQLRKLADFGAGEVFHAETYDGDTPPARRRLVRRRAQVVLTNPDMLHVGILPYHSNWADFFRELRYVVLDEVHVYTGVFGAHTANVIRRLRRVAAQYGSQPTFICCSATVGNPGELAETLTGLPQRVVADDGSPQAGKLIMMWNPPLIDRRAGQRRSANMEAAELLAWLVRQGVRTIVFTLARRQAELIARYARDRLPDRLREKVTAYRAGYLPEQRRAIERRLFDGDLLGVVATSALELGIDIGGLDAVIMAGYPGRVSSFWQRAGRAGRRHQQALVALVALETGVDQYIMSHPDYLLDQSSERILFDPQNPYILAGHLMCAAYELPIAPEETALFGPKATELLEILEEERYVTRRQRWHWLSPDLYPAGLIGLRSASGAGYDIFVRLAEGHEELLGTVDDAAAFRVVHPGAVYLHEGTTYLVTELDIDARRAIVVPLDADYYTQPLATSHVTPGAVEEDRDAGDGLHWCLGELQVTEQVIGYRKRRQVTEQDLGTEPLDLPAKEFETQGLWIAVGQKELFLLAQHGRDLLGSLHAVEHALIAVVPLFVLCDERDIGGASYPSAPGMGTPAIFLYDGYPGGVGIVRAAFQRLGEILAATADLIAACPCEAGCPSCIQSAGCGDGNWPLDKAGAAELAAHLAQRWHEAGHPAPR